MTGSITIIEPDPRRHGVVESIVDSLITKFGYAILLRPGKVNVITKPQQLTDIITSWPDWTSRPWIIAGNVDSSSHEEIYTGPFIRDCSDNGYNKQIESLLAKFDWALFSYFTTYHNDYYNFITSIPAFSSLLDSKNVGKSCKYIKFHGINHDPISCLPYATFYDYAEEGFYVYEMAIERGEELPFLLCQIESYREKHCKSDIEKQDAQGKSWYEDIIKCLEVVDDFVIKNNMGTSSYVVFRVNEVQSYLDLWKEASYDHSIADATLSGDTDLSKLRDYLSDKSYFEIDDQIADIGTWAYSQIYGGGSDEHHAIFYSRNSEITHQLWNVLGDSQISRF